MPNLNDKKVYLSYNPRNNMPYFWSYRGYLDTNAVPGYTRKQMQEANASCIADILYNDWWGGIYNTLPDKKGWTLVAIAGALGNYESECTLNPALIERKYTDPDTGGGIGLPQWTPNKKWRAWCDARDLPYNEIDTFAYATAYEMSGTKPEIGAGEWIAYWKYTYYQYSQLEYSETNTASRAATIYYTNYERSAAQDPGTRPEQAEKWYEFLLKNPPKKHPPLRTYGTSDLIYYLRRRRNG